MKKILLSLVAVLVFGVTVFAQVPKMAMVEEFTQASCPPCEVLNPLVSPFLKANTDKLVLLKYHTSWPGADPMNDQTEGDVRPRVDYYGVSGVPNLLVGGGEVGASATTWAGVADDLQVQVNSYDGDSTPLQIVLTHVLADDLQSVNIMAEITNTSADMFDASGMVVHVAIVEEEINFPEPPGSTAEQDFLMVMRKMIPDASGTSLDNIPAGETVTLTMNDVAVPRYIYNYNKINVVTFVQHVTTKAVEQAAVSSAQALSGYADIAARSNTQAAEGLCEYDLTPSIRVQNDTPDEITSLEVSYTLNDGTPVMESWSGSLKQGQWDIISFPTVQRMPPSTLLDYSVVSVNGFPDVINHNNGFDSEGFFNLASTPNRTEFKEGCDIDNFNETPEGTIFANEPGTRVILSTLASSFGTAAPDPVLGGFGNSDGTFMFDYYNSAVGQEGMLILDKVDFTNSTMTELRFSHAYAQYAGTERDRMEVLVSTDCGDTWTTLWDLSGANLATAPSKDDGFFIPNSTQWKENTVDLSAYDGAPDVVIAFRGTSAFGNLGYIDDINVGSNLSNANDVSALEGDVQIFPNPVSTDLVINLQLDAATTVTAEVYNMAGKKVATIESNNQFPVGTHTLNWNVANQANGMYMVRVLTEKGEISRRISVLK